MAQFVTAPPFDMVKELFTTATGLPFSEGVSWTVWQTVDPSDLYIFRPYIRKCHQQLLMEPANGKNACSFLRQVLRPHCPPYQATIRPVAQLAHGLQLPATQAAAGAPVALWQAGRSN